MKLNALYVGTTNMRRSLDFYREVFRRAPAQEQERFSIFNLGGAAFGIFYAAYDGEDLTFGNNCVPNIQVDDIGAEYERLSALALRIDRGIREIGSYRYFQFADLDGNWIELYEFAKSGEQS
jgi:predicted enzyme related to lactoylglutathione lyase